MLIPQNLSQFQWFLVKIDQSCNEWAMVRILKIGNVILATGLVRFELSVIIPSIYPGSYYWTHFLRRFLPVPAISQAPSYQTSSFAVKSIHSILQQLSCFSMDSGSGHNDSKDDPLLFSHLQFCQLRPPKNFHFQAKNKFLWLARNPHKD